MKTKQLQPCEKLSEVLERRLLERFASPRVRILNLCSSEPDLTPKGSP